MLFQLKVLVMKLFPYPMYIQIKDQSTEYNKMKIMTVDTDAIVIWDIIQSKKGKETSGLVGGVWMWMFVGWSGMHL